MKNRVKLNSLCFLLVISIFFSCKKGEVKATVETAKVTEISAYSALCGGTITDEGSSPVTARGVCYSTLLNPTLKDIVTEDGDGIGTFASTLDGLYSGVAYFVRAYATNSAGTSYGNTRSFSASGEAATATISAATNITASKATLNGFVNPNSVETTINFQYGITVNYDSTIYGLPSPVTGDENLAVSAEISGLKARTVYHFRIVASNVMGTFFSGDNSFTTLISKK